MRNGSIRVFLKRGKVRVFLQRKKLIHFLTGEKSVYVLLCPTDTWQQIVGGPALLARNEHPGSCELNVSEMIGAHALGSAAPALKLFAV
jgi:hypothetical protein